MRVLIPDAGNPPASFIRNLVSSLSGEGVTVDLTSPSPRGKVGAVLQQRGLLRPPAPLVRAFEDADVVHFQWPPTYLNHAALARETGTPCVLSLRGRLTNIVPFLPGQEPYRRLLETELPHCDGFHCVSSNARDAAVPLGLDPSRAHVIRPAIDVALFRPVDRPRTEELRICMVGALMWRKGYEYALVALKRLQQSGRPFSVRIVGEGPDRERVFATTRDLDLEPQVELLGSLPHDETRSVIQSSDVLLHTSLSEGISNAVLEAMGCALPVVVWDSGGMGEAIADGQTGRLIKPRDIEGTWRALADLADDVALADRLGTAARRRVEADFDLKSRPAAFVRLYEEVLTARRHT